MSNAPTPPPSESPVKIQIATPYTFSKINLPFKGLIYGIPGSGKTRFAGTSQQIGGTLFFNIEGGMLSVEDTTGNVMVFDIFNTPDGDDCATQLEKYLWILASRNTQTYPWLKGIKTVVLDSGSELLNIYLESLGVKASKKSSSRDATDIYMEDYGKATTRLIRLFRMMRDLPYNVIVTALQKGIYEGKEDNKSLKEWRPSFTEKLGESVMGFFDFVWCAYSVQTQGKDNKTSISYHMLTAPMGYYRAKTRGTAFPQAVGQVINNPDFKSVYQLLQKSETSEKK